MIGLKQFTKEGKEKVVSYSEMRCSDVSQLNASNLYPWRFTHLSHVWSRIFLIKRISLKTLLNGVHATLQTISHKITKRWSQTWDIEMNDIDYVETCKKLISHQ